MISNEAVQRLIACDRETLVALMAAAADRAAWATWPADPDIRALIDAARGMNAMPATRTPSGGWMAERNRS